MKRVISIIAVVLAFLSFELKGQNVTLPEVPNTPKHVDYTIHDKGFWFSVLPYAAYAFHMDYPSSLCTQIELSGGYRFSEYIKLGIGIAPRMYFFGNLDKMFTLPIFAEAHGNFITQYHSSWAPCWKVSTGYSLWEGYLASVDLGVRFGGIRNNFVLYLNYSYQACKSCKLPCINLLGLKLGYEF